MTDPHCHSSSILVPTPVEQTWGILAEGLRQGQWTWGSWEREEVEPGLFRGTSLFDGKPTWVRPHPDKSRWLVDYEVGRAPDAMAFRNSARLIPGPLLGHPEGSCVVTLLTWRTAAQTDEAWAQISVVHEAEMFLIRGLLQRGL